MATAQIGLMIEGQDGLTMARWRKILKTAEDAGYQCVFRSDHFTNAQGEDKDSLELWISLTVAALETERIEFGSMVTPVTFRHPSFTARYGAQVNDLSGGRLVLGLGAGWQEREHKKFGIPFYDFATRYEMFEDALEMTKRLYESDDPVFYDGRHYTLEDATLLPRPQQQPKILIGGNGPKKTLPLVAKYADEWNAVYIEPETYVERTQRLNDLLEENGRQPGDVKRSLMTRVVYFPTERELNAKLDTMDNSQADLVKRGLIVGTGAQITEQLDAWVDRGIERFTLQWIELDDTNRMTQMAEDILPHFHGS